MRGLTGVRLVRVRLGLARHREEGRVWAHPLLALTRLVQKAHRWVRQRPGRPSEARPESRLPCPIPFRELVLNCDGTFACGSTADAPILDDLADRPEGFRLSAVWEGPGFRAMRARMLAGDAAGCRGCPLHRCPGFEPLSEGEGRPGGSEGLPIRQLLIEPTAVCNLDCPTICGRNHPRSRQPLTRRRVKVLPMDLYRRLVAGLDVPIDKVCFYNYGEPLLHPEFSAMCRLMRERLPSALLTTSTNGSRLVDPRVRAGLLDSGLDEILVSMDGASQATYEVYRRGGRFDEILEAMRLLREARDRAGLRRPRIIWRYILFPWNDGDEEMARAEGLAREIGVDRFCYHLSDLPEMASGTYRPGSAALERIRDRLF